MITLPVPPTESAADAPSELRRAVTEISEINPWLGLRMVRSLGRTPHAGAAVAVHLLDAAANDRRLDTEADRIVDRAVAAQESFENWTEERVDHLLKDMADEFATRARTLAEITVRETGIGNVRDKTVKNRFASLGVYASLAGQSAQGRLTFDPDRQVTELASPVGVVLGVVPVTNPAATAIFKTLIALKGRNALIVTFPQHAHAVATAIGGIVRRTLESHGAPADIMQWIGRDGSRALTRKLMGHPGVSLVLATGGAGLVRAAYSSGKPAIGVGPGNAPAWVCADADLDRAARLIVTSKAFDNGLICGAEHNLVVDERGVEPFVAALEFCGAAVLSPEEAACAAVQLFDAKSGAMRREFVGQSASAIARVVGIYRPHSIRLIVLRAPFTSVADPMAREKLAPALSLFTVSGEDEGIRLCRTLLKGSGAGHTASIHTTNAARVERFARAIPAGRILVNTPSAHGCCGITTGLDCSMTLGCGTFGGNSTTDNVTFRHLLNIKRVARDQGMERLRRME
jgi:acetaldehyde dehydrogenase/alcohol dehydrogenase